MRRPIQFLLLFLAVYGVEAAHSQGGPPFITDDPGTPGNRHWEINLGWSSTGKSTICRTPTGSALLPSSES